MPPAGSRIAVHTDTRMREVKAMSEDFEAVEGALQEGKIAGFWADVRQTRYPPEFRIDAPGWPGDAEGGIAALINAMQSDSDADGDQAAEADAADSLGERSGALADMATQLWRIGKRLTDPKTGEVRDGVERQYRTYQAAWDALTEMGVEVKEYTGEPMPETGAYSVNVIAFESVPGINREIIEETVKPAVYFDGQRIQTADVIVATPEDA